MGLIRLIMTALVIGCLGATGGGLAVANSAETPTTLFVGRVLAPEGGAAPVGTTVTLRNFIYWSRKGQHRVLFGRSSGYDVASTVTDGSGRFVIPVGELNRLLQDSFDGPWIEARTTDGLRAEFREFSRDRGTYSSRVELPDLTLAPTGMISGRVVSADGTPSSGTAVALTRIVERPQQGDELMRSDSKWSDAQGRFEFDDAYAHSSHVLMIVDPETEEQSVTVTAPSTGTVLRRIPSQAVLAGVVLDGETRQPIVGTTITLAERGPHFSVSAYSHRSIFATAVTDEAGRFRMENLRGGVYSVQQYGGMEYKYVLGQGSLGGSVGWSELSLQSGETSESAVIYMVRGFTMAGQVVDPDGRPLEGVKVSGIQPDEYEKPNPENTMVTGPDGKFRVLSPSGVTGTFGSVYLDKPGYFVARGEGESAHRPEAFSFRTESGRFTYEGLRVVLATKPVATGRVIREDGKPLAGDEVRLTPLIRDHSDPGTQLTTDQEGRFSLPLAVPGLGAIEVTHPRLGHGLSAVTLINSGTVSVGDIRLGRTASIAGIVVNEENQPVPEATVSIHYHYTYTKGTNSYGASKAVVSDLRPGTDGRFRVEGIPSGFSVSVWAQTALDTPTKFEARRLEPGQSVVDLQLVIRKGHTLSGIVFGVDGQPVPNAYVSVSGDDMSTTLRANAEGKFSGGKFPRGSYNLEARSNNGELASDTVPVKGGAEDIRLTLKPRPTPPPGPPPITVRVLDGESGKPLPGVKVLSIPTRDDQKPEEFQTDEKGELSVDRMAMSDLEVSMPGYASQHIQQHSLFFPDGQNPPTVRMFKGHSVRGRIVDSAGNPLKDVPVRLSQGTLDRPPIPRLVGRNLGTTDADGRIDFGALVPAKYALRAIPSPPFAEHVHEFTVQGSGELDLGDIALNPATKLSISLQNSEGQPFAGSSVRLNSQNQDFSRLQILTDESGKAVIEGLMPGMFHLTIDLADGNSVGRNIRVRPGKNQDIQIQLPDTEVQVLLRNGDEPVHGSIGFARDADPWSYGPSAVYELGGMTKKDGSALFRGLPPGKYSLIIRAVPRDGKGQLQLSESIEVKPGRNTPFVVQVNPGSISGVVVDRQGKPIPNAEIWAFPDTTASRPKSQISVQHKTDGLGRFTIGQTTAGSYYLQAKHPDIGAGWLRNLTLAPGQPLEGLKVVLDTGYGRVVSVAKTAEGRPVDSLGIVLRSEEDNRLMYSNHTPRDSNGVSTLNSVAAGKYAVTYVGETYAAEPQTLEVQAGETANIAVAARPAGSFQWDLNPGPSASFSDLKIRIAPTDPDSRQEPILRLTFRGPQGDFLFRGLWPGNYTATATLPGKPEQRVQFQIRQGEATRVVTEFP